MLRMRVLFIVFFVIVTAAVSQAAILLDRVVAIVNQEVITWSELYKAMESDASPQMKELKEEDKRKVFKENEASFLETLINMKLQLQEARNLGVTAGDDEVKEAIDGIMKKYSMTDAQLKESLKKEGFTLEEYKRRLQEQIIVSKVVNRQIRSKILVTERDVQKYIDENGKALEDSDGYRISVIFFKKPAGDDGKKDVEEKAAAVLQKLHEGTSFADLARQYSEDPSGNAGGDLGFIKKQNLLKDFSEIVSGMNAGELSRPFWTEKGLYILRLDEKIETKDPAGIREKAKEAVTAKLFTGKYNAWLKSLREKSFIEIKL
jgi:peptidyl-prolyl cis-trans isomerase SurA